MQNEEIRRELEQYGVEDNPFDVMLHHALELTRAILFASSRMKNNQVPETIQLSMDQIDKYVDTIRTEFDNLSQMSEDTVKFCRNTCGYSNGIQFNRMNKALIRFEQKMDTVWSRSNPARKDAYERIRLGEDSEEYKHIEYLRNLVLDESSDLFGVSRNHLYHLHMIIDDPETISEMHIIPKEDIDKLQKIINKYKLTIEDVEYLISFCYHE